MQLPIPALLRLRSRERSRIDIASIAVGLAGLVILAAWAFHVERLFFLGDDSFISFRYAAHLAQGEGLTWNPGERVEGYTNFLWVVAMAAGIRVGIAPEFLSIALGISAGLAILLALVRLSWLAGARGAWLLLAPAALALSRSFAAWSTGGLETMAFAACVLFGLVAFASSRPAWISGLLLACATLLRPDGAIFAMVCGAFALVDALRRRDARRLLFWLLPLVLIVVSHLLWRRSYYGFWLPNTFYAKVSGLWWEQAGHYFGAFFSDYRLHLFLPLLVALPFFGGRLHALFAASIGAYAAFLAMVGGDVFEFRLLVPLLPLLYWLLAECCRWLASLGWKAQGWKGALPAGAAALALLAATWTGSENPGALEKRHGIESVQETASYARFRIGQAKALRAYIDRGLLPAEIVFSTGGAGAIPYYTGWTTVDFLGLNDVYVAHMPIARRGKVAHEKRAPFEYLQQRKVAIFDATGRGLLHATIDPRFRRPLRRSHFEGLLKIFRIEDRFLIFGTTLQDEELRSLLPGLEPIQ